jgi:hypothetical protein
MLLPRKTCSVAELLEIRGMYRDSLLSAVATHLKALDDRRAALKSELLAVA